MLRSVPTLYYVLTIKKDHDGEVHDPHQRLVIHRVPKMV
jgi:hypothetical protein